MTDHTGFTLEREQKIAELDSRARFYRHITTGAQVLSLHNDDENKVFGITFRTPPADDTGIAHILEHSVLCGSHKYPVKEPFVELLKGSLQTFLNAFTYPDKTCYPVASQHPGDFANLIDVYLDAVFHPRLGPQVLQQEGWHYEADSPDGPLSIKGVVYNEMKGAYSSPDRMLLELCQQALFPDSPYGLESGGHPRAIPELTYETFLAFHRRLYHPSNARIWFWGDFPEEERLALIAPCLEEYEALDPASQVPLQTAWNKPRQVARHYAAGADRLERGAMVTLNWLLCETLDASCNLGLELLEFALLGMPASPLRKALIDSGLGEDLAGIGLENELRQMYFSTGLKGVRTADLEKVEDLVLSTLQQLARQGIDQSIREAAVNRLAFRYRENHSGSMPRGLILMLRALTTWLYDGDPFTLLASKDALETITTRVMQPGYLADMIRTRLLDNPHRLTLHYLPDKELEAREAAAEKERLETIRAQLGPEGMQQVVAESRTLHQLQEKPDAAQDLAKIPVLARVDLEPGIKTIPLAQDAMQEWRLLYHDLPCNGIAYLDIGFDLCTVPRELLPYVRLFGRALLEMGTEAEDFSQLAVRINRTTGGMRRTTFVSATEQDATASWLALRCKVIPERLPQLMDLLGDILLTPRFSDQQRFRQILLEAKARLEESLVPAGHAMVNLRLRAMLDGRFRISEEMRGISQLVFLRSLLDRVDKDWPAIQATLEQIRSLLVNRRAMICNATMEQTHWEQCRPLLERFAARLPAAAYEACPGYPELLPANEGLAATSQVNYVGKGINLYRLGYRYHGSALVISHFLRSAWLWDQVRVQGGAYGAHSYFDRLSGLFSLTSYRDPNLLATLDVFNNTARYLQQLDISTAELDKAVIGAVGKLDAHQLPDARGFSSMYRTLLGTDDDQRQRIRDQVLATNIDHFREFGHCLEKFADQGVVSVLGSRSQLETAAASLKGGLQIHTVL